MRFKNASPLLYLTLSRRSTLLSSSSASVCKSGISTFCPRISEVILFSVTAAAFSSPSSGSTVEMYSEKELLGDRIAIRFASRWSRWRYIRNAARCMATLVFPEPAPARTSSGPFT